MSGRAAHPGGIAVAANSTPGVDPSGATYCAGIQVQEASSWFCFCFGQQSWPSAGWALGWIRQWAHGAAVSVIHSSNSGTVRTQSDTASDCTTVVK